MTSQDYVNQALSAGLSQSTIDSFIANNPGDYGRIWSAFNLGGGGYASPTTAPIPVSLGASVSNPTAALYTLTVAGAAAAAAGSAPVASDEILTITGTLGGVMPEHPAEAAAPIVNVSQSAAPGMGFDAGDLIKIALLIVVASWVGSALFSGRN